MLCYLRKPRLLNTKTSMWIGIESMTKTQEGILLVFTNLFWSTTKLVSHMKTGHMRTPPCTLDKVYEVYKVYITIDWYENVNVVLRNSEELKWSFVNYANCCIMIYDIDPIISVLLWRKGYGSNNIIRPCHAFLLHFIASSVDQISVRLDIFRHLIKFFTQNW